MFSLSSDQPLAGFMLGEVGANTAPYEFEGWA